MKLNVEAYIYRDTGDGDEDEITVTGTVHSGNPKDHWSPPEVEGVTARMGVSEVQLTPEELTKAEELLWEAACSKAEDMFENSQYYGGD